MLLWIITATICVFVAWGITVELFPQPQFTVDLAEIQSQTVTVYTYHDQGTPFPATLTGPDSYACDIPQGYWKDAYHLEFTVDAANNRVLSAVINGEDAKPSQIVHVADLLSSLPYSKTVVITTSETAIKSIVAFCVILAVLLALCLIVRREIAVSGFKTMSKTLLCGGAAVKAIGKKGIFWAVFGVVISCFIAVGSDIDVILVDFRFVGSNADIFQYLATVDQRHQIPFLIWCYNPSMLMAYFLGTIPLQLGHFTAGKYHIICYLFFKLLNGCLILITVISILSFLEKRGVIAREKCGSIFLWSFFNPLVFYVAVVYIQLDIFPACCLVLGCLLFVEKKMPSLSGILLAVGLSCKMQNVLLSPAVIVLLCIELLKGKEERRATWKAVAVFAVTLAVFLLPFMRQGGPVALMAQYSPQSERVWWTTLQYASGVFFQITPGVLVCAMIMDMIHLDLQKRPETLVLNTFYMFGAIVLLFSFSILSTPSTLIHCLAAFTLLNVMARDRLQRLIIAGLSLLMVFEVMFSSVGDVARLLSYAGIPYNFTVLEQTLNGTDQGTRLFSILFTISHAAMLAFGLLFCKKAIDALRSDDGNGCRLLPHIEDTEEKTALE